jgi:hypothetical protein
MTSDPEIRLKFTGSWTDFTDAWTEVIPQRFGTGTSALRHFSTPAPQHRGTVAPQHRGTVAPWHRGTVAPWHRDDGHRPIQ